MSVPDRPQQVAAVTEFLEDERTEDFTCRELAGEIVDGYHNLLTAKLKPLSPPLRPGLAFKTPYNTNVNFVAWIKDDLIWIVHEKSKYGWLGRADSPMWQYVEEWPDRRIKKEGPRPGEPGTNEEWFVGDRLFLGQRRSVIYTVLATGSNCVLMQNQYGEYQSDSNESLKKYYRRES